MSPQFGGSTKTLTTPVTPVFVVAFVESGFVLLHVSQIPEPGRTEGAAVRPLPRVTPNVYSEVGSLNKPGGAKLTLVSLQAVVIVHMCLVISGACKRSITQSTHPDFLCGVSPFV